MKLGFGQGPACEAAVALFVRLMDILQGIDRKTMTLDGPASKAAQRLKVNVASSRSHAFIKPRRQPAFHRALLDVTQRL